MSESIVATSEDVDTSAAARRLRGALQKAGVSCSEPRLNNHGRVYFFTDCPVCLAYGRSLVVAASRCADNDPRSVVLNCKSRCDWRDIVDLWASLGITKDMLYRPRAWTSRVYDDGQGSA